ncbi:PDZ domain-containing protein [Actinomycetospora endophytica]|uniref:endopeptidase La n=1 Tax=Actinomycetospora endophytica TaxID=2291215 RepID=A0ABS8P8K2_9PSEU|nr:S16 family serine protease [Actinomycetospora endophytica]MCD2194434.1 PDZ domain-containing protein [Actinomycetospora endophytica]
MTRLRATIALGLVLAAVLGLAGATVRVPFVALGDGPTFDVLGDQSGKPIIDVSGPVPTYPTSGQLRMTTVAVTSQVTLFGAIAMWVTGSHEVVPREQVYPTGQSSQQVDAENTRQFSQSENDAQTAALRYLGYPSTVQIGDVTNPGPSAGLLNPGDRVLTIAGRAVTTPQDVVDAVGAIAPGTPVVLRVQRGADTRDVTVTAAARPGDASRGYLGITAASQTTSPANIKIGLADVGGPSAGLIFATAIVDKLTPGELTGGKEIAGTGTIDADGRVGPIGGIRFKMDAARDDGAQAFLVPAGNCSEAVRSAPSGLTLARVSDLREGVSAVQDLAAGRVPPTC